MKVLVIKVGTDERPAGPDDIIEVETKFKAALKTQGNDPLIFVTHHAVSFETVDVPGPLSEYLAIQAKGK